ncbi:MAG: hypothetical protein EX285_04900 [Thaumarchaeota archaeon]|jgi:hypothetical protein|nr:hypothetical protein [Nitrososphaerota archaeon]
MGLVSIDKLADTKGLTKTAIRSLMREVGGSRIKVGRNELYNENEFDRALVKKTETMQKRTITKAHLDKMLAGKKNKK